MSDHRKVLIDAIRGDDDALTLLVRENHARIYRYGLQMCRDGFDADDAVQEAFRKLATRPDVLRGGNVLGWLLTVVRHACLRLMRPFARERRALGERVEDANDVAATARDPHAVLEHWRMVRAVHRAIAALETPYREVLVMRDLEGLSGLETSISLGINEATMKTRLHRARHALRERLVADGELPLGDLDN